MISSSNQPLERGLDAMLIVYSLLEGHPASTVCERLVRTRSGWFTTTFTIFEAKAVLTKVYAVDAALSSQKLAQFATGSVVILDVDLGTALSSMSMADGLGIDLTDAVLLQTAQAQRASRLATDDGKLMRACHQTGITPETPIDAALRQQMTAWEDANLPVKGLPRLLRHFHRWLIHSHPQAAQDFWSQTGAGSHLP